MAKQKLDPKHVRDFFYRHALSVRILTLIFDGIWWLIAKGFVRGSRQIMNLTRGLWPFRFPIDEKQRQLHSFIVGRTGAGKSVLLHNLIRHYLVKHTKPTVVVLDPHGDLARLVAQDKANVKRDRLLYIQFSGISKKQIHFNPFDIGDPSEIKLNKAQVQFAGAVEQIIGEPFTPRQRTLIRACMGVLLHKKNTTFVDLIRLLQDGQNADLVEHGQSALPNMVDRQFFRNSFGDSTYRATKQALISRLTDIARDPIMRQFTCHQSSFNFFAALDSGKVIVVQFDPSLHSRDTIRTIGQLINAAILSHVLGRSGKYRHPIHLFIDECQFFVSPTIAEILGESRKFGLYLSLATQRIERLETALQDAILGNVGTLWIGSSRNVTAEKLARETDISAVKIRQLPNLQFFEAGIGKPVIRRSLKYLGRRYCVSPQNWSAILSQQAKRYYRSNIAKQNFVRGVQNRASWKPDIF